MAGTQNECAAPKFANPTCSKTIHGVLTELYSKQQKMVCNALSRKVVKEVCIGFPQRIQPTKVPTHKMIVEAYYKPLKLELLLWPGHKMIVEAY